MTLTIRRRCAALFSHHEASVARARRAADLLEERFAAGDPDLVLLLTAAQGAPVDDPRGGLDRRRAVTEELSAREDVD